ncbi:MAG TPA: hypothetical protein ENJ82_04130, partial [Bacteroidetes bacterium]|nr:hypothetical protein [Bacteroidota bacterium]
MRKTLLSSSVLRLLSIFAILIGFGTVGLNASGGGHNEESEFGKKVIPISEVIIEHVMDSHDWHLADIGSTPIALHLPWMIYNSEHGMQFFASTHSMLEEDHHYLVSHESLYYVKDNHKPVYEGPAEGAQKYEEASGKYVVVLAEYEKVGHDGEKESQKIATVFEKMDSVTVIDFSLTKTALHILLVALLMIFIFLRIAKAYKKREGMAPKGMQSFFEPLILFVREDVAKPYLHGKHDRYVPYLLSLFFFIWIANLFGLTPLSSNIAGNTTITIMLAMLTLVLIILSSKKDFWMHIFWFPGVPLW